MTDYAAKARDCLIVFSEIECQRIEKALQEAHVNGLHQAEDIVLHASLVGWAENTHRIRTAADKLRSEIAGEKDGHWR